MTVTVLVLQQYSTAAALNLVVQSSVTEIQCCHTGCVCVDIYQCLMVWWYVLLMVVICC